MLILTHAHPDHIGSAKAIKRISGCTLAAHAAEKAWIEDVLLQAKERPVPGFFTLVGGSVQVDRVLNEGDVLHLDGGPVLRMMHTPGHSPGSLSLWLAEEGALITADAVPIAGDMPIYQDMLQYLQRIHSSTLKAAAENPALLEQDFMQLCRGILADLGLPPVMANPLVASSFQASLSPEARNQESLLNPNI